MITLIEATNFRSLKYISQPLGAFHVLIGANAAGKTTFLDVAKFMADIVALGLDRAIELRASYFDELTFGGKGGDITLAIEARLPDEITLTHVKEQYDTVRYELCLGALPETNEIVIKQEHLSLKMGTPATQLAPRQVGDFPAEREPDVIAEAAASEGVFSIISRNSNGISDIYVEPVDWQRAADNFFLQLVFNNKLSAFANLPADVTKFPAATWFRGMMQNGVQLFVLDSLTMRNPSSSGQQAEFRTDGSNLPWVIDGLQKRDARKFTRWIEHVQTALPDVEDIFTVLRDEDRKRYIKIRYKSGIEVPAWLVSDGTLRLLALTLPAYLKDLDGFFMVEEPENGIHPKAIEAVFLSLSSVYKAQVLMASHSAVVLGMVSPEQLLCFAKTSDGVTDIISGADHPKLKDWKGNPNLNLLFASGILS